MQPDVWIFITNTGLSILATVTRVTIDTKSTIKNAALANPFYLSKVMMSGEVSYHLSSVIPFNPEGNDLILQPASIMSYTKAGENIKKLYYQFLEFYNQENGDVAIIENPDDSSEPAEFTIENGTYAELLEKLDINRLYRA